MKKKPRGLKYSVSTHLDSEAERKAFKLLCTHADINIAEALRMFVQESVAAKKLVINLKK